MSSLCLQASTRGGIARSPICFDFRIVCFQQSARLAYHLIPVVTSARIFIVHIAPNVQQNQLSPQSPSECQHLIYSRYLRARTSDLVDFCRTYCTKTSTLSGVAPPRHYPVLSLCSWVRQLLCHTLRHVTVSLFYHPQSVHVLQGTRAGRASFSAFPYTCTIVSSANGPCKSRRYIVNKPISPACPPLSSSSLTIHEATLDTLNCNLRSRI